MRSAGGSTTRALMAGSVGNVVEWYEFGLFGAFATMLAVTFFPGGTVSGSPAILAVFGVFGVAFFTRPAGALLFGSWGDRHGRRPSLVVSILLMSVATAGIGLLPGFASVGWGAPVLLVLLRGLQGVAIGGEYGASAAFVVEHAPPGRRGWYGGLQWATLGVGLGSALAAGALVSGVLSRPDLLAWGWRVPFLLAGPLGLFGLYVRLRTAESPAFVALERSDAASRTPIRETLRLARREVLVGLSAVAAVSGTTNTFFVFLPSELDRSGHATLPLALVGCLVGLLAAALVSPAAGAVSDRLGRRPVLVGGASVLLVAVVPAMWLAVDGGTAGLLLGYTLVGVGLGTMGLSAFLSELFPSRLRHSGLSLTYGLASAVVGGTAPALAAGLAHATGSLLAVAAWVSTLVAVGMAGVVGSRETVGDGLDTGDLTWPPDSSSLGDASPRVRHETGHSLSASRRRRDHVGGANYEIRISGRVSDSQMSMFQGLAVTTEPVETVVHGPLPDQEAVHELLLKLQALGLEVVAFRRLPGESGDGHEGSPPTS